MTPRNAVSDDLLARSPDDNTVQSAGKKPEAGKFIGGPVGSLDALRFT
jgi:hypothetical protein